MQNRQRVKSLVPAAISEACISPHCRVDIQKNPAKLQASLFGDSQMSGRTVDTSSVDATIYCTGVHGRNRGCQAAGNHRCAISALSIGCSVAIKWPHVVHVAGARPILSPLKHAKAIAPPLIPAHMSDLC